MLIKNYMMKYDVLWLQENFGYDILGLFLLICGFRFLAFLALLIKSYRAN